jgi:hypothetical protein
VSAMAQQAYLYGIIILPSSEVELDFLPLLHRHQIVESTALSSRKGRRRRALGIVDDAARGRDDATRGRDDAGYGRGGKAGRTVGRLGDREIDIDGA